MPNGEAALIVNLKDDLIRVYDKDTLALARTTRGAILVGAHSRNSVIDTEEQESVFGVQFHPGGAFPFCGGIPSDETANEQLALEDLWNAAAADDLRTQLLEALTIDEKFDVAERCLLARLRDTNRLHAAVEYGIREIAGAPHVRTIEEITRATGLSPRRFIQLFREQAGLTPKVFCRVRRFQRAISTVHRQKRVDWIDVALACGYYDQPHFIHDFREFSGMTPSAYLAAATEHLNHVPVLLP